MRSTFVKTVSELAETDDRVFLLTPDMGYSVLEGFAERFPDRFLNTGIAEQNTIGIAAGLALSGYIVYVYSIIPFVTMRCFEQVRLDLAYNEANVRLVGIGAGMTYGSLGPSHHACEDIAIMRSLPGMKVVCPGDPVEVRELLLQCHRMDGPVYFRLGKNGEPDIHGDAKNIRFGRAAKIADGKDVALITTSNMLEQGKKWTDQWRASGIGAALYSMHTMKPFDSEKIAELVSAGVPIVTLEEHGWGGLGTCTAEAAAEAGGGKLMRIGVKDEFSHHVGGHAWQRARAGLDKAPDLAGFLE